MAFGLYILAHCPILPTIEKSFYIPDPDLPWSDFLSVFLAYACCSEAVILVNQVSIEFFILFHEDALLSKSNKNDIITL